MKRLAQYIIKYSKLIIALVIVITLLGVTQIKNLTIEDDVTKYLSENDPEIQFYQDISEKFGKYDNNLTLVSLEYNDLFELKNLKNFKLIIEQLEKSDYIISVNSFLNMPKIISTDFGIEVNEFVETFPQTDQEALQLKKAALEDSLVKGTYLSADGQVGLLMVESLDDVNGALFRKDLESIINQYKENVNRIEYSGLPIMNTQISEMALSNISLAIIAALVILALLYYYFRSIQGTLLPILVALLSSLWILSLIASSGQPVTIIISVIPIVMLSLVTAYGIHFISRYYEERHFFSAQDAVKKTIELIFIPIFMSALTTMAGFASLVTAVVKPMTEFGVFASIGIFVAFLLVIFFLGALFSTFVPKKVPENFSYRANDLVTRLLKMIAGSIINRRNLVIGIIITIVFFSIVFSFQVKPDSSIENRLGQNNPITKSTNYFKEKFGGVDFLYVYLEADNVKHPYILRSMDKIQNYAGRLPSLSQPTSITTFLTQLNEAMENKKIIPANPEKIDNLWFFSGDNEYINSLIANENQNTILQVRSQEMTSLVIEQSIEEVRKFVETIPKTVKAVNLNTLGPGEKEQYFLYIVEDILSSWQASRSGMDDTEKLKDKLIQIAGYPLENFIQQTKTFAEKVIGLTALELEDLGIATDELQPILLEYLEIFPEEKNLLESAENQLNLISEDAYYLKDIIDSSIIIASNRERIEYAENEVEKILGRQLEQGEINYLWYLTDDYVYVPDAKGEINFSYRLTGIPVITNQVNASVFRGQIQSMLTAFIVVCILLILQFGSILIGIIAMIPIILTILTAFGIMGITGITLNIGTMMVASIAIGAGIDYTIHYINRYKQELKRFEPIKAMKVTLTGTGRAIVFNSVSMAAGLFVLSFSQIAMISEFAKLIGSVMLISVVYTLLLLPLLLHSIKFKEEKKEDKYDNQ